MKTSKNLNLIAFTSLILCSSCNQNSSKNYEERIADIMPQIITIEDYNRESVLHFSDFADSVVYVQLDDCQDAIISHIDRIEVTNNGDYLIFDSELRKIVRFDSLGNFLNLIGALGHGPNEMVHPVSITYNRYSDHVFVNDNGSLTLLEYDLEGKILNRKCPVPFYASEMGIIDETHYCFYSDFVNDKPYYNYHITDTLFNVVGVFEGFQDVVDGRIGSIVLMNCRNSLFCKSPRSNYLYKIEADSVIPLYQIEHKGDVKWLSEKDPNRLREELGKHPSYCFRTFFSDKYIFIENLMLDSGSWRPEMSVYNTETKEILTGFHIQNNLVRPCSASWNIHAVQNNKLLSVCFPEDFERSIEAYHSHIVFSNILPLSAERIDTLQSFIDRFTPYAQRKNATIEITYLK